jgi:hypothetical protein
MKLAAGNQAFQKFSDPLTVELKQEKPNAADVTNLRESQTLMDTLPFAEIGTCK